MILGPTSHSFTSQRLRLHYVDWGNAGAPPILMIHGGRDHCRNWDWVAQAMRERFHVMALDLRGHGDSDWAIGGAYSHNHHIQDITQFVAQKIEGPVILMAHSLGAMLALAYAGLFPDRVAKLIAIEGLPPAPNLEPGYQAPALEDHIRGWIETRRELAGFLPKRYPTLAAAEARMREENPHLSEAQARHLTEHAARQNEDGSYSWKFDRYARLGGGPDGLTAEQQYHLWRRISCPVLLVRGADSFFPDPSRDGRVGYFRDARLVTLPDAGHWAHHDQLDRFMNAVWGFLDE